jgi:glycosyltransferase involved in cell wall biosynthesis
VPAFNEAASLGTVLAELKCTVPQYDVLVIDDGSSDATAETARAAGVAVARLPFNLGVGGAVRTGLRYAHINGYSRAVKFDADGQHDPREIDDLLKALSQGHDLVIGSRFAGGTNYQVGKVRGGAMYILRVVLRLLSARRFTDPSSGFMAFSEDLIKFFSESFPPEYLSDSVEAVLLAIYAGFSVVEIPTEMRGRVEGQPSTRNLKLVYHFVRLLVVLSFTASLRGRKTTVD